MTITGATSIVAGSAARTALKVLAPGPHRSPLLHFLFTFGPFGLFLVSIIDSSFVPLPVPGITDIMLLLMAARHSNWLVLVVVASIGSIIGGYLSYRVGQSGGMAFLEKRVPPRIFNLVREWMEHHAVLAVALPAILPPPVPLSPFVLAAGALKMSKRKFLTAFTISRTARHLIAVGLGLYYGRPILRLWNHLSAKYATTILIITWSVILISCVIAFRQLYKASKAAEGSSSLTPESSSTV
ncbi:MAG TPA: VTT domain-containing protein [Edaphobacter sp.]|jgi:membrane protein YqaA with SNARE-associated domain